MDDYLCLTILSASGESVADFKVRLSRFWTHMLRVRPDDFERVYAETTTFEEQAGRWSRRYLIEALVAAVLELELAAASVDHLPLDPDDTFSRYEAAPPEWMQIEH